MKRIKQFTRSIKHAIRGLAYALKNEKNFQNEIIVAILVIAGMFYFKTSKAESIILFLLIMAVLIMELLNTIMERVVDILKPKVHPYARLIKDLMAASVLLTSLFTVIVGIIIFLPHIISKFQGGGMII